MIQELLDKAVNSHQLKHGELLTLLQTEDSAPLLAAADSVRRQYVGNEVHLRALIEFSNHCRNNCCYCGIRRANRKAVRYRLKPVEIINLGQQVAAMGFKTVVLQSGEDAWFDVPRLTYIISALKNLI